MKLLKTKMSENTPKNKLYFLLKMWELTSVVRFRDCTVENFAVCARMEVLT